MKWLHAALGSLVAAAQALACSADGASPGASPEQTGGSPGAGGEPSGTGGQPPDPGTGGFMTILPPGNDDPDAGECGGHAIATEIVEEIKPANLLVIMDRSQSLGAEWLTASDALVGAIGPIAENLTVGAIFFPSGPGANFGNLCTAPVEEIDGPGQIDFLPGVDFINAWATSWTGGALYLGTPTDPAAQAADLALDRIAALNDDPTTVLVMTDGAPTCRPQDPTSWMDAFAARWLAERNIKTYVLGIVGGGLLPLPPNAPELNAVAVAGGTGAFISPGDNALLAQELQSIVSKITVRSLSQCDIRLDPPPPNLEDVHLVATQTATGVKYEITRGPDGWSLNADGSLATLSGRFCEDAKAGTFASIEFLYGCVDVPPLIR